MAQDSLHPRVASSTSVRSLVDRALEAFIDDFDLSEQTVRRLIEIIERFGAFLERGEGVQSVDEIVAGHVRRFITAPIDTDRDEQQPATATMHLRRACVRLLFRKARELGIFAGDPTLDIELPPRTSLKTRPLTDEEVALCRSFSLHSLTETRHPAAWALAEGTARTSEIPEIRVSDLDMKRGRVWIGGSTKTDARWGMLTSWGLTQLQRRVGALHKEGDNPLLVYRGGGSAESKQAASCIAISETLVRAGLGSEPDVRPPSVSAWIAIQVFEETGQIEEVARRLGLRSLDRAARFIDWDWKVNSGSES